jgi:hypothetical protein
MDGNCEDLLEFIEAPTKEKGAIARPFPSVREANGLPGFPFLAGEPDRDQFSSAYSVVRVVLPAKR